MTIGVGFLCRDGVVIGADRQITGASYTFPECKLGGLAWKNGRAVFGYSGSRDTHQLFRQELGGRFDSRTEMSEQDLCDLVKASLEASLQKKEQFFLLLGMYLDGRSPRLFMSTPAPVRILNVNQCEVIGYGDSPLSRSLIGRFKATPGLVSVHQARIYAVRFISEAKKYDGQYVGDGIDVYSVETGGTGAPQIRVLDAGASPAWEEEVRIMTFWMDVLFNKLTDKDNKLSLDQFTERMNKFREWSDKLSS